MARKYLATVRTPFGFYDAPGRFPSVNAAHAAARRVAHRLDIPVYEFETIVAPAPSVAETAALMVAGIAFAGAIVAPWFFI